MTDKLKNSLCHHAICSVKKQELGCERKVFVELRNSKGHCEICLTRGGSKWDSFRGGVRIELFVEELDEVS